MDSSQLKPSWRNSKRVFSLALATIALAAAAGCDSKHELPGIVTQDTTALAVVSTVPVNGAVGVTIGSAIRATFNEQVDPTTLTAGGTFQVGVSGGSAIDGVVSYDSASMTATFTPARLLAQGTAYTASLLGSIKDLRGNPLAARVDWSFTTVDNTRPSVTGAIPPRGNSDIQPNAVVIVHFSEPMDPSSINANTFTLFNATAGTLVSGTITVSADRTFATLMPTARLIPATAYTITVTVGAKDLAGNPLVNEFTSNFFTTPTPDVQPPEVVSTSPANGDTNVRTNGVVTATFSEQIDLQTLSGSTFFLKATASGGSVAGTISYDGSRSTAVFTPTNALAANTSYTATLTTGIMDYAGNPMAANKVFSFTTAP